MIMVSILCLTYNHEKYIEDALLSFVNQQTDFEFEVIVNDDASSDGTAEILKKYQKLYPSIIKPIFHDVNQHSKGINNTIKYMIPKAKGKYIAFCEGDDYFIDNGKLQKQVDFLEEHSQCSLCIHNAYVVDVSKNVVGEISSNAAGGFIPASTVIERGGGFISTNSIMTRSEYLKNLPGFFRIMSNDFLWQAYFAQFGETYCFPEKMSAYRKGVEGSWTSRMKSNPKELSLFYHKKSLVMKEFDEYTKRKYHKIIMSIYRDAVIRKYRFLIRSIFI